MIQNCNNDDERKKFARIDFDWNDLILITILMSIRCDEVIDWLVKLCVIVHSVRFNRSKQIVY